MAAVGPADSSAVGVGTDNSAVGVVVDNSVVGVGTDNSVADKGVADNLFADSDLLRFRSLCKTVQYQKYLRRNLDNSYFFLLK